MATKRIRKREQAISSLLSCRGNVKAAAEQCGMSYSTLLQWLRNDGEFIAMYNAEKKSLLDGVKSSLLQSAVSGAKIVQNGLDDETTSPLERFPIAKFALESALNLEISQAVLDKIDGKDSKSEWDCTLPTRNDEESESE